MALRIVGCFVLVVTCLRDVTVRADIYRWDNGELIPGTEGIEPGPGVQMDHGELEYAKRGGRDLGEALNLAGATFKASNLANAYLQNSTLTNANLGAANLTGAYLGNSTLRNAKLSGAW